MVMGVPTAVTPPKDSSETLNMHKICCESAKEAQNYEKKLCKLEIVKVRHLIYFDDNLKKAKIHAYSKMRYKDVVRQKTFKSYNDF